MPFGGDIKLLISVDAYEVGQRSDKHGVNLISYALGCGIASERSQQRG